MKSITNIKRNIYIYFILILIFSIVLFFSSFMFENYSSVNKYNNFINSYMDIPDIYMLRSTHSIEDHPYVTKFTIEQEGGGILDFSTQVLREAVDKGISKIGVTRTGIHATYCIEVQEVRNIEKLYMTEPLQPFQEDYPNLGLFINDLFGENIKFPLAGGRNFTPEDFKESKFLPVIAGSDYKSKFKVGDNLNIKVIKYYTDTKETIVPAKIIGFLENNTEVMTYAGAPDIINANKVIIIGLSSGYKYEGGFFNVFPVDLEGVIETKSPDMVEEKILELARTMGYEGKGNIIRLYAMKDAYQDSVEFNDRSFSSYFNVFGISVVSSLLLSVLAIYLIIRKNKYEYGVLLICGATRNKIRDRILLENLIIIIFTDIIGMILTLKYIGLISPMVFIVYNALILSLIYTTSSLILKNKKTIEFINYNQQNQ